MKRISCSTIIAAYGALFEDFLRWGYGSPAEYERDLSRLHSLIETRGDRVVTIDFPGYAKSLDKALSRGAIHSGDFPLLGSTKDGVPEFLNSIFSRVFDGDGNLLDEADHGAVKNLRQSLRLFQKVVIPCGDVYIKETVNAFFSLDAALRCPEEGWTTLDFFPCGSLTDGIDNQQPNLFGWGPDHSTSLCKLAQRVCDAIVQRFDSFDADSIVGRHGPGAVADSRSGNDKYVFPTWSQQLERVFPRDTHSSANPRLFEYGEWYGSVDHRTLRELPAKLIAVPKVQDKPRLIASEPTSNQFMQGGINKYLRHAVSRSVLRDSISFKDQGPSKQLAIAASFDSSIATVDLKDASDRLTCWTVQRVFRSKPRLLEALASSRSRYIVDTEGSAAYALLRKYAPQGNATVFPLQSITYAMLAISAVIWVAPGRRKSLWSQILSAARRVRVFGDDLIVPTDALPALSSLLELCQLKVNGGKSHYMGNFAESCGCDAFRGTDVTPVFLRHVLDTITPQTIASHVAVSNNCFRDGLISLSKVVESWIPEYYLAQIPITRGQLMTTEADLTDMLTGRHDRLRSLPLALGTFSSGTAASRYRFCKNLHREEVLSIVLDASPLTKPRNGWESLFQWFIENPEPETNWSSGWITRVRHRLRRKWVPVT